MKPAAMMAVVIGCFALALAGLVAPAEAACVTYVGPGTATLTANVIALAAPCASGDDPLIQVTGPFTLDMAGFKVDCGSPGSTTGIRLLGSGVVLKNGLVTRCTVGVDVAGTGTHKVQSVVARNNTTGFKVQSNKNELTNSSALFGLTGFDVTGNQNKLDKDVATENVLANFGIGGNLNVITNSVGAYGPGHGFAVTGDKNKFTNNTATGADPNHDGFFIQSGSSLNEFTGNVASDNGRGGIVTQGNGFNNEGNTNKFTGNFATGNEGRGFRNHESDSNQITNNTSVGNNQDGIRLGSNSNNNLVKGNRTSGNGDDGIDVNGTNNTITENLSYGNGITYDLEDDTTSSGTPPCPNNSWTSNIFGTSSSGCIQ